MLCNNKTNGQVHDCARRTMTALYCKALDHLYGIKKHDYFFAAAALLIRAVQLVNPVRLGFTV